MNCSYRHNVDVTLWHCDVTYIHMLHIWVLISTATEAYWYCFVKRCISILTKSGMKQYKFRYYKTECCIRNMKSYQFQPKCAIKDSVAQNRVYVFKCTMFNVLLEIQMLRHQLNDCDDTRNLDHFHSQSDTAQTLSLLLSVELNVFKRQDGQTVCKSFSLPSIGKCIIPDLTKWINALSWCYLPCIEALPPTPSSSVWGINEFCDIEHVERKNSSLSKAHVGIWQKHI